jgi:hypothetical protein
MIRNYVIYVIIFLVFLNSSYCDTDTVTANIYADNYFEFYVNGVLIKKDPLDFTPHNGVQFKFNVTKGESRIYAIKASDFATPSGYEYTNTDRPQLGDGALIISLNDGTVSNSTWKCFTTSFGPTDESISAGCNEKNLNLCKIKTTSEPINWQMKTFDDSTWTQAKEYTTQEAGWGRTPSYSNGYCGTLTDPLTGANKSPSSIKTEENECLDPQKMSFSNAKFIWQGDLKRDNTILCRYLNPGTQVTTKASYLVNSIFTIISLILIYLI